MSQVPTPEDKARYEATKKELLAALPKKRVLDKQLAQIEVHIYNLESHYLTETAAHTGGNIITGFEGYLKNQSVTRRRYEIGDADRMFSNSSLTYQKSLEMLGEGEESAATNEDFVKQGTPVPTTAAQRKAARDKDSQRKKRAGTAQASDDESISARKPSKRARMADDD